jgi:hypothetical protein
MHGARVWGDVCGHSAGGLEERERDENGDGEVERLALEGRNRTYPYLPDRGGGCWSTITFIRRNHSPEAAHDSRIQ